MQCFTQKTANGGFPACTFKGSKGKGNVVQGKKVD